MPYDWRKSERWSSLDSDQKWAAMALMEAGTSKLDQAKNVSHAIHNRARLLGDDVGKHIETRKGRSGYGWYQPLYEANQYKRLPGILKSKQFSEMLGYVKKVKSGEIPDTVGGATRYLVPPKTMLKLSGGVRRTSKGLRGNSKKYYSWPGWTGFDPKTKTYANQTKLDGVHAFLTPKEDQDTAKRLGYDLASTVKPPSEVAKFKSGSDYSNILAGNSNAKLTLAGGSTEDTLETPDGVTTTTPTIEPGAYTKDVLDTFEPTEITTVDEALEEQERRFGGDEVSWSEAAEAAWETNFTNNNIEYVGKLFNPAESVFDENFRVEPEQLKEYDESQWDFLLDSRNALDFESRKAELTRRNEALQVWAKTTWGQYLGVGLASLAVDVVPAVLLSIPTEGAAGALLATTRLSQSSRIFYGAKLGIGGGVATGAELALTVKSGQMTPQEALMWTAAGGLIGAGIGAKFRPGHSTKALSEAAEDSYDEAVKLTGETPKPIERNLDVETDVLGSPPRVKIDADNSPIVYRDGDHTVAAKAVDMFDDDVVSLESVFKANSLGANKTAQTFKDGADAFQRQGYRLQEKQYVYVAVPAKSTSDLQTVFKRGIAVGFRDESGAKSVLKRGGQVYKVTVQKGSKVFESDKFNKAGASSPQVIFGEGALKRTSKALEDGKVSQETAQFVPDKRSNGLPQFSKAVAKDNGEALTPAQIKPINDDLFLKGIDDAEVFKRGSSVGAHRASPQDYKLQGIPKATKELLEAEHSAPLQEGMFMGIPWSAARGSLLINSKNFIVRRSVGRLMGGLIDLDTKALEAGAVRPMAADEVKTTIIKTFETRLMKSSTKNYRAFKKEYLESGQPKLPGPLLEEKFNDLTTTYQRAVSDGLTPPDVPQSVATFAKDIDGITGDLLDLMGDPGKAIGRPGDFDAVAGMDAVPKKRGYMPRSWSAAAIHQVDSVMGNDSLFHYLRSNLKHTLQGSELKGADITAIARGMNNTIRKSKGGWSTWMDSAFGKGDPQQAIAMIKASGVDISEETLVKLKTYLRGRTDNSKPTAGGNTHFRTLLTESLPVNLKFNSRVQSVTLRDFTETNATQLIRDYIYKNSGRIALGSLEIPGVKPGEFIARGIKSDQDWAEFMDLVGQGQLQTNSKPKGASIFDWSDEGILDNYYQYMTHTYPNSTPDYLRFLKMMGNIRYLGRAGFAQVGETATAISIAGAAGLRRLPAMKQLMANIRDAATGGDTTWVTPLTRLISEDLGIGDDMARMAGSSRFDQVNSSFTNAPGSASSKLAKRVLNRTEKAQNLVMNYSGLVPSTSWSQIRTMEALHDNMLQWATKHKTYDKLPRRHREFLQNAGLNKDEIENALRMYADPEIVIPKNGKFKQVETIEKGSDNFDHELYHKVQNGFARMTTRAIQENKWSLMPPGFDHPVVGLFAQLKSFMIGSYTAQLVNSSRNLARQTKRLGGDIRKGNFSSVDGAGDSAAALGKAGIATFGQMASGVLAYIALQEVVNLGVSKEEAEARREKIYNWEHLTLAAISRSGWLGSVPFIYDTTIGQLTGSAFNGYRSSGMTEDIFGNPVFSTVRDLKKGGEAISKFASDEEDPTTKDLKNITNMVTNLWMVQGAVDWVGNNVFDLEPPEPRKPPSTFLGGIISGEDDE
jgi:hypothetical protein